MLAVTFTKKHMRDVGGMLDMGGKLDMVGMLDMGGKLDVGGMLDMDGMLDMGSTVGPSGFGKLQTTPMSRPSL